MEGSWPSFPSTAGVVPPTGDLIGKKWFLSFKGERLELTMPLSSLTSHSTLHHPSTPPNCHPTISLGQSEMSPTQPRSLLAPWGLTWYIWGWVENHEGI